MENTLGKRIAALRRQKELTQDNLAQILDVSSQAVSKWENDQTCPDIEFFICYRKIFSSHVSFLQRI